MSLEHCLTVWGDSMDSSLRSSVTNLTDRMQISEWFLDDSDENLYTADRPGSGQANELATASLHNTYMIQGKVATDPSRQERDQELQVRDTLIHNNVFH